MRHQFEAIYALRELDFYKYQALTAVLCHRDEYFDAHQQELPKGMWRHLLDKAEAHLAFIRARIEHDTTDRISEIAATALIVNGSEFDLITGVRMGQELHERIGSSRIVILDGAPHATRSVPEAWRRYSEEIVVFLAAHSLREVPAA